VAGLRIVVVGGGPAGLCAALEAAKNGARVTVIDDGPRLGGQLIKQTHSFFGFQEFHAGTRGINIAKKLVKDIESVNNIKVMTNTTVTGFYEDKTLTLLEGESRFSKITADKFIISTGASENMFEFGNNDLPGVYGAGAVQTLMNLYGVLPGREFLMVGSGNVGLIVSYQLMQAGAKVKTLVEAAPRIGGYLVHASKIRRLGVEILTGHTLKRALKGDDGTVCGAEIVALDENWNPIKGSERTIDVDTICLATGLTPLVELLWQAGCEMKYVPELGGHVPARNEYGETTLKGVYVAGDAAGIEEATSAMIAGMIAGIHASGGAEDTAKKEAISHCKELLKGLRSGPAGKKIEAGLEKAVISEKE